MKRTASAKKTSKSSTSSIKPIAKAKTAMTSAGPYVVCVKTGGYVDLELLKIYKVKADAKAAAEGLMRVLDGSGEDYLFPANYFRAIQAPANLFSLVKQSA